MIHPYTPPNPIPNNNAISNLNSNSTARMNQIIAIDIEQESHIEREKLNYQKKQAKKSHNKTYTEFVWFDSYYYARGGKPYHPNSVRCFCCDKNEDYWFNIHTCLFCFWLCPMRCLFYIFYFMINNIFKYIWKSFLFLNECLCHILERIGNGICICFNVIGDLLGQCCNCIILPVMSCCSGCYNSISNCFGSCCNFISDFNCWEKMNSCCLFVTTKVFDSIGAILSCFEWIFSNLCGLVFNILNSSIDCILTNILVVGKCFCESLCSVLCLVTDLIK